MVSCPVSIPTAYIIATVGLIRAINIASIGAARTAAHEPSEHYEQEDQREK
jgi:hypothetical protein